MAEQLTPNDLSSRRFLLFGVDMRVRLSSAQTDGQFSLVEGIIPPGGDAGLHMHAFEDETMHLLEGQLEVTIGNDVFDLRAGENYFAPRNVPHRLRNVADRPASGIVVTTPGGFDAFIARAGIPLAEKDSVPHQTPPTAIEMERVMALAHEFRITIL